MVRDDRGSPVNSIREGEELFLRAFVPDDDGMIAVPDGNVIRDAVEHPNDDEPFIYVSSPKEPTRIRPGCVSTTRFAFSRQIGRAHV